MGFGSLISLLPLLGTSFIYYPNKPMLVGQTGTWHVAHKCICSARFMLARIVLYCFSLLKMYCIHPWFGISICSVLKEVFVVEYFISVTLQAKEIKKYIVRKRFPDMFPISGAL